MIGVVGPDVERVQHILSFPGVEQVIRVSKPYKLASREHHPDRSGCGSAPSRSAAARLSRCWPDPARSSPASRSWPRHAGSSARAASALRGGAFKPRSSPYAFQGLGIDGLRLLAEAREETGLPVVSEVTDPADVETFDQYVDMLQVGSRNMHNFVLLRAVGQSRKPVLLKRGFGATIEEWLMAAEYILSSGNPNVDAVRTRHPHLRAVAPATRSTFLPCPSCGG